jgi:hypothetical protein
MRIVMLLFFLVSCGDGFTPPAHQASAREQAALDAAIEEIQNDFNALQVPINLRAVRYVVNDIVHDGKSYGGYCYYKKNKGHTIAISHSTFEAQFYKGYEEDKGWLYKILLHEIGHCFFRRKHESRPYGKEGEYYIYHLANGVMVPFKFIMRSVMETGRNPSHIFPKELWPYYVREIAGLERFDNLEELSRYVNFERLSRH